MTALTDLSHNDFTAALVALGQCMRKIREAKGVKTRNVRRADNTRWSHSHISNVETGKHLPGEDLVRHYQVTFCKNEQETTTLRQLFNIASELSKRASARKNPAPSATISIEQADAPDLIHEGYTRTSTFKGRAVARIHVIKKVRATIDSVGGEIYRVRFNMPVRSVQAIAVAGCTIEENKTNEESKVVEVRVNFTHTLKRGEPHTYDFVLLIDMDETEPFTHITNRSAGTTVLATVRIQFDPNCAPTRVRTQRGISNLAAPGSPSSGNNKNVDSGGFVSVDFADVQPQGTYCVAWEWPERAVIQ